MACPDRVPNVMELAMAISILDTVYYNAELSGERRPKQERAWARLEGEILRRLVLHASRMRVGLA